MGTMMQAVVCYGIKDYRLEAVVKPSPGPGEILGKVLAVGICAGDSKCYSGAPHFWSPGEYGPSYCQPPVIPGHEFVCEIVEFGEGAKQPGLEVGDHAVAEQIVPCEACRYCTKGDYNMCRPHNIYGFRQVTPGAMAEYMIWVRNSRIHKIPKHLDPTLAVFV